MNETQSESRQEPTVPVNASVMARRRMLLASLGKGSAVLAAVSAPMHSLAALSVTANGKRCTVSGTMSGVHSQETITTVCAGKWPTYYSVITQWPNWTSGDNVTNTVGVISFNKNTEFSAVFGGGSSTKLIDCITNGGSEGHWVTALLNGTAGSTAQNFPYTAQEVINLYKAGGTTQSNALNFFTGYMETLT